jgi:hypothetical protein
MKSPLSLLGFTVEKIFVVRLFTMMSGKFFWGNHFHYKLDSVKTVNWLRDGRQQQKVSIPVLPRRLWQVVGWVGISCWT